MTYHHREAVGFVWAIADLLRGTYKAHDYGDVILPLVVLRRLDQALADTKPAVLARDAQLQAQGIENREPVLRSVSKRSFYNTSPLIFDRLLVDEDNAPAGVLVAGRLRLRDSVLASYGLLCKLHTGLSTRRRAAGGKPLALPSWRDKLAA